MNAEGRWLEPFSWEFVTAQNEVLCSQKSAHHGPTSDGHDACREVWERSRKEMMTLYDAVKLCRRSHRIAPFTNYNGNTFAAIVRTMIKRLGLAAEEEFLIRSLAGHIVAGVAGDDEVKAFRDFCEGLG